jgi:hypothetical protein
VKLGELTTTYDFQVLEHLEADLEVPVLDGLQAQGDLFILPTGEVLAGDCGQLIPAAGVAVIEALGGGHEHRLFAGTPGTAWWKPIGQGQDIGILTCTEPAYVLHPEHGATGIAPGSHPFRRQREQADEERLVAD